MRFFLLFRFIKTKFDYIIKVLTQNILNKDGPSVLSRLYGLFSERIAAVERNEKSASCSISDLVVLLIYVYSLIGEECFYGVEEEQRIKVTYFDRLYLDNLLTLLILVFL